MDSGLRADSAVIAIPGSTDRMDAAVAAIADAAVASRASRVVAANARWAVSRRLQ
jgi:hypothetical protein